MKNYFLLTALTPIAHGDTATGMDNSTNKRIFMRQQQVVNGFPVPTPHLSENALRGGIVRQSLANHLIDTLEIKAGELPQAVMNLLFSGGGMKKGAEQPKDRNTLEHQAKALYPMLNLLGGSTDGMIMKGCLSMAAWIVCKENDFFLNAVYQSALREAAFSGSEFERLTLFEMTEQKFAFLNQEQNSVFDLVGEETRTRGTNAESEGNQMPFTYEVLASGTQILMRTCFAPRTNLETASALSFALQNGDGFFGGKRAQGRGLLDIKPLLEIPDSSIYLEHIEKNRAAMRQGLIDGTFGTGKVICA